MYKLWSRYRKRESISQRRSDNLMQFISVRYSRSQEERKINSNVGGVAIIGYKSERERERHASFSSYSSYSVYYTLYSSSSKPSGTYSSAMHVYNIDYQGSGEGENKWKIRSNQWYNVVRSIYIHVEREWRSRRASLINTDRRIVVVYVVGRLLCETITIRLQLQQRWQWHMAPAAVAWIPLQALQRPSDLSLSLSL